MYEYSARALKGERYNKVCMHECNSLHFTVHLFCYFKNVRKLYFDFADFY